MRGRKMPMCWVIALALLAACSSVLSPPTPAAPDGPEPPAGRESLLRALEADWRFGGAWMDGQLLRVGVTQDALTIAHEYASLIPADLAVEFHAVDYAFGALEALKDRIALDIWSDEPVPPGGWPPPSNPAGVTFIDADEVRSRVVVGIKPFRQAAADELRRRYGPMVEVIPREPMPML